MSPRGIFTRRESRGTYLLSLAGLCMLTLFVWLGHSDNWVSPSLQPVYGLRIVRGVLPLSSNLFFGQQTAFPLITSEVSIHANLGPRGDYSRKRYLFKNVWLRDEDTLAAFLPPGEPLPTPLVSNAFVNNVSSPRPPTAFTISMNPRNKVTINVDYRPAAPAWGYQPVCTRWEERPVFLLFTPHHNNVWHILVDALIASFQTLREEGLAPLALVNDDLKVEEFTAGLAKEKCPKVFDIGDNVSYRPEECHQRAGLVPEQCHPEVQEWCRPGLVAVNRTRGPIFLLSKGSRQPGDKWRHLFFAVTDEIRDWKPAIGTCFRELYIGKSSTLNFYMPMKGDNDTEIEHIRALRSRALRTVQELLITAQTHHAARLLETAVDPANLTWTGYADEGLERLRQGVGPEDIGALDTLRSQRLEAIRAEIESTSAEKMIDRINDEHQSVIDVVRARVKASSSGSALDLSKHPILPLERYEAVVQRACTKSRPVITFMRRSELSRCALNEADLLEYVLRRYNVTVRVTTFEEPALEMMQLMNSTDAVIGMHGAGWTNTLFLKPGAAGLQMLPYGWRVDSPINGSEQQFNYIRGVALQNVVQLLGGAYAAWVNPHADHAFIHEADWQKAVDKNGITYEYSMHPQEHWDRPSDDSPGDHWIYQNTLLDIEDVAPAVDAVMAMRGIEPVDMPILV